MNRKKRKMLGLSLGVVSLSVISLFVYEALKTPANASPISNKKDTPKTKDAPKKETTRNASTQNTSTQNTSTQNPPISTQPDVVVRPVNTSREEMNDTPPPSVPNYPNNSLKNQILQKMTTQNDNRILLLGDSQVGRTLTNAANSVLVPALDAQVYSWYVEGTTPTKVINDHVNRNSEKGQMLKSALAQKFPIVIIQLGDNGISSSAECINLINYINSHYPKNQEPLIIWSGPFPLCLPNGQSTRYVTAAPCDSSNWRCITYYQEKKKNIFSGYIYQATSSFPNARFVSPYHLSPFNIQNAKCFTSDGVHILQDAATLYFENLLGVEPT